MTWLDADGVEKGNLIGRLGPDEPGGLALVGHTDCVPFDPDWGEALSGTVRDGKLFGRGSADTKGSIAAMLSAASRVRPGSGPLWLLFTADEEVGCQGAKALAHEGRIRPAKAIIGEPTRLVPVRAHKGYCAVDVTLTGVEGHSAFPDVGASAIHAAVRLVTEIERIQARLAAEHTDPVFSPPHTTFNVGIIRGGKARNVLAGECFFTLEWRPLPGPGAGEGARDGRRGLARARGGRRRQAHGRPHAAAGRPGRRDLRPTPRWSASSRPRAATARTAIPFGTELPELIHLGAEACVFGPGDIRVAHRTGEFVPLPELHQAAEIYGRAIARFCA